jgi:hypothetical protein
MMRGEIVHLEETKVRAIRKTVEMRLRLANYDAALAEAGVTQETRHLLGLEIDRMLGTASTPATVLVSASLDSRTCSLNVLPIAQAFEASPISRRLSSIGASLSMPSIQGRIHELRRATQLLLPPSLSSLKLPGMSVLVGFFCSYSRSLLLL